MDEDYPRGPGSRVSVLLVGMIVGAVVMTAVWVGIAGNPLSDVNEVVFTEITVAEVSEDRLCWSEEPERRDASLLCAIPALDSRMELPATGDDVVIGLVTLRPRRGEERNQIVHVAPLGRRDPEPGATES